MNIEFSIGKTLYRVTHDGESYVLTINNNHKAKKYFPRMDMLLIHVYNTALGYSSKAQTFHELLEDMTDLNKEMMKLIKTIIANFTPFTDTEKMTKWFRKSSKEDIQKDKE